MLALHASRSYLRSPGAATRLCHAPAVSLSTATALAYSSMTLRHCARIHRLLTLRHISPVPGTQSSRCHSSYLTCCTDGQLKLRFHPYSPPSTAHLRAPSSERQARTTRRASRRRLADPSDSKPTLTCPCSWCGFPQGARHSRGRLTCASEPRCSATTSNSGQARTPDSPPTERHVATHPSSCWQQSTRARRGSPDRRSDGASSHEQATQVG